MPPGRNCQAACFFNLIHRFNLPHAEQKAAQFFPCLQALQILFFEFKFNNLNFSGAGEKG